MEKECGESECSKGDEYKCLEGKFERGRKGRENLRRISDEIGIVGSMRYDIDLSRLFKSRGVIGGEQAGAECRRSVQRKIQIERENLLY